MKRTKQTSTFADAAKEHAAAQADALVAAVASIGYSLAQAKKAVADAEAKLARLANG